MDRNLWTFVFTFASASPGLKEDFQFDVFKVLAAILHLGNVEIRESGSDKSFIAVRLDFCHLGKS